MITEAQQRVEAAAFAAEWQGRGYEKGECQPFWLGLLRRVFGVGNPEGFIRFESPVRLGHTSFIDGYIPSSRVLIEQKALHCDLRAPIKQSDGSLLTPFRQAKRYADELPYSERPRYIVISNFERFHVYDMEHPLDDPEEILLAEFPHDFPRLSFLTQGAAGAHLRREARLSIRAGELVGRLYDALLARTLTPEAPDTLRALNIFCVRLVFCLYAEDAGLFGARSRFHDYLFRFDPRDLRRALIDLFEVLDTPPDRRDPYLDPDLAAFPYVNGGLFAERNLEVPTFDLATKALLLADASDGFDWSGISPTIFGAVFESTLNPETRRQGGMHYTSIENIHKVIDPLFLDALRAEFESLRELKVTATREKRLRAFQEKLAALTFLDPACGSGNFLTETYLSLRRLENDLLRTLHADQMLLDVGSPIRVSITQLHGIEVNDFAVTVARTALWIAEAQALQETEDILHHALDLFPLRSAAHIQEANALTTPWPATAYIMGNPPFVGARYMDKAQKADLEATFAKMKGCGDLDYVTCWYRKAADAMKANPSCRTVFVSTNSIAQGIQPSLLWKPLFAEGFRINFGVPTFRWDSESLGKAAVHCVIIGFSLQGENRLTPYLTEGEPIVVEPRHAPPPDVSIPYSKHRHRKQAHRRWALSFHRRRKSRLPRQRAERRALLPQMARRG